ncbi:hypothetical protein DVH05_026624 [Phytophthora capsici]|nr:hypothetical protein DVH05_026624 [Phytophthora capsici]
METLVPWLHKNWKLRELVLTRVTCISGSYAYIQAQELTKITIRQCYQVQEPAIVAPNLETLVIQHCPMVKFRSETSLLQLKNLLLSLRSFTASRDI